MQRESFMNNEIAERLLERLDCITLTPSVIANHSVDNAVIANALKIRYPHATQIDTQAHAEMIIAHAHLLQETDPAAWFIRCYQQLAVDGIFLLSSVGPDTLQECRAFTDTLGFPDMHDLGDALVAAGFVDPVMEAERITLTYDDLATLVDEVNALSLLPSVLHEEKITAYPKNKDGHYALTFEVIYGHAWKSAARPMKNGEVRISVESVGRSSKGRA